MKDNEITKRELESEDRVSDSLFKLVEYIKKVITYIPVLINPV